MSSRTYVVIVNWNGWSDTIECLESVLRMRSQNLRIVICDNASTDRSLDQIQDWAEGSIFAECGNPMLAGLTTPPIAKPVSYRRLTQAESEAALDAHSDEPLVLIQSDRNLGFAAGCNVGIRYALKDRECDSVWLLNNDTVVEPEALSAMIAQMQQEQLGMCGSVALFYHKPEEIQVIGGPVISKWTGRVYAKRGLRRSQLPACSQGHRVDFVAGASWLISRKCLEEVGLLEESYFLYCEEPDLVMRARGKFNFGYSIKSFIYHKAGASAGSSRNRLSRSVTAEWFGTRSRILLARRFFPLYLPSITVVVVIAAFYRMLRGHFRNGTTMLKALWEGYGVAL